MGIIRLESSGVLVLESGGKMVVATDPADCVLPTNYIADVLLDNPVGYWQLNDASGSAAVDSSGNGRDGTYIEAGTGPTYKAPGPFGIGDCCWTDEEVGAGNSYIRFDTTAFDSIVGAPSQGFTMEIWQRAPASSSGSPNSIFDKTDTSPHNWNTMQILTDGRFNVQLYDGSNNPSINSPSSIESSTVWYHLVLVRDVSTPEIRSYINGVEVGSSAVSAAVDTSNNTKLSIGARQDGSDRHSNHAVAHAALYDFTLSPTRIASHYTTGTTNP